MTYDEDDIANLRGVAESMAEENDRLRAQLATAIQKHIECDAKLEREMDALRSQLIKAQEDVKDLMDDHRELHRLRAQLASARKALDEAQAASRHSSEAWAKVNEAHRLLTDDYRGDQK